MNVFSAEKRKKAAVSPGHKQRKLDEAGAFGLMCCWKQEAKKGEKFGINDSIYK